MFVCNNTHKFISLLPMRQPFDVMVVGSIRRNELFSFAIQYEISYIRTQCIFSPFHTPYPISICDMKRGSIGAKVYYRFLYTTF